MVYQLLRKHLFILDLYKTPSMYCTKADLTTNLKIWNKDFPELVDKVLECYNKILHRILANEIWETQLKKKKNVHETCMPHSLLIPLPLLQNVIFID